MIEPLFIIFIMRFSSLGLTALAGLILIGGGCANSSSEPGAGSDSAESGGGMFERGQSMTCEWTSPDGSGTSYIKGEKVRTDVTADGGSSTILAVDGCAYIWETGAPEGLKFCYTADAEGNDPFGYESYADDVIASAETSEEDTDPELEMDCDNTNLNDSLFTPPSDVTFSNPFEDLTF